MRSVVPMSVKHRTAVAAIVITVVISMQSVTHHNNWHVMHMNNMGVVVAMRRSIIIARLCSRGS